MANYLTIDIGNTTSKAAAWTDSACIGEPVWGSLDAASIEHLCAQVGGKFDVAAICSVAGDAHGLIDAARALSSRVLIVNASLPLPISIDCYHPSATLGSDRIAALCGAHALLPAQEALVVDCGTCVTYDRLSADGRFLGGNIAPGIGMRMRAMHSFTAKLPAVDSSGNPVLWGDSTAAAMQAGAFYGVVAEIEYYMSRCPRGTRLLLTGGRAADLAQHISKLPCTPCPALVLQGLKHIIDYNENK